ncbi:MAG: DUF1553 domain-containing protein [Bacteroidota bacterium]
MYLRLCWQSLRCLGIILFALSACQSPYPEGVAEAEDLLPKQIDFNLHVKPILSDRCFACHGPDKAKQKAGLRLDLREASIADLPENPGFFAIVAGDAEQSELVRRILDHDPERLMPPPASNLVLSDYEKALLIRWIEEGAEYKPHWSFKKPQKTNFEAAQSSENPIDFFVRQKAKQKGFSLSPEADKESLIRRLSLDLTGLPPTIEEIDAFIADERSDAYEQVVDKLLASASFGERLAVDWMDLARFADTHGYTVDRYRDMSPWRDWVIQAFNRNMPYDQFVSWQLAGDLLPDPTREQLLATGFNRNHSQNMEGGIVDEEFRVEYVVDRTNTLGAAFLGLTLECSRCHDHKYDPISQKEYYQLFSFFNNVQEAGQISFDNAMPVPTLLLTEQETQDKIAFLQKQINAKSDVMQEMEEVAAFQSWLKQRRYQKDFATRFPRKPQALFELDRLPVRNLFNARQTAILKQQHSPNRNPELGEGKNKKGLALDGDAWLDLGEVGVFKRSDAFSVGIWVKVPQDIEKGVIFHKGDGAALYNFRGYQVGIQDNHLQWSLAHTMPYNALVKNGPELPRDQWVHLLMTYDGSSQAKGMKLYLNGKEVPGTVEADTLYKGIGFPGRKVQPGLQIGARWRGKGIKGALVDEIIVYERALGELEALQLAAPEALSVLRSSKPQNLSDGQKAKLKAYYLANYSKAYQRQLADLQSIRASFNLAHDTAKEVMIMQEMTEPRASYILDRGQYDAYAERVSPATPASVMDLPEEFPKNRLGLAQWLFHPDHPLTARVAVNRYWQMLWGRGLVKSSNDFGNQGDLPSHPELLDYLAVTFQESAWDLKALLRLMLTSETYRQSSVASPERIAQDPDNVWLSRGPKLRLTAEMIRDQALAAAGLLHQQIGGPSVKPYQPAGLWRVNGTTYVPDSGKSLFRRSLYTFWKRTVPYPTQSTFDAPSRSLCTVKREETSTPLQALILLNDPTFVEASQHLGHQIAAKEELETGITTVFRSLVGRAPRPQELALLREVYDSERQVFAQDPSKREAWLPASLRSQNKSNSRGEAPGICVPRSGKNLNQLAACAVVASTILNSDACLVKR